MAYHRNQCWSVTSSFFFRLSSNPSRGPTCYPGVQYPPIPSNPVSNPQPSSAGFGVIPATNQPRGDSENDMSFENLSGAQKHSIDSGIEVAKTILKFVSSIQLILYLLSYSFCLKERRLHSNSRIVSNRKLQILITRYRTPNLTTTFTASRRFNYHC